MLLHKKLLLMTFGTTLVKSLNTLIMSVSCNFTSHMLLALDTRYFIPFLYLFFALYRLFASVFNTMQ